MLGTMHQPRSALGAYLFQLRTSTRGEGRRTLSQAGLVERCAMRGVTQTNLARFERGSRIPSVVQLEAILAALGVGDQERAHALRCAGVREAA